MSIAVITGSAGLVGSQTARFCAELGLHVVGLDNDLRSRFFGDKASTLANRRRLQADIKDYRHCEVDVRDGEALEKLFREYRGQVSLVVHAAAQPSHDWAASDPATDFHVNAVGTLNLLEAVRKHGADAVFIFTSTNKVYGDLPNRLPLEEEHTRWELPAGHSHWHGIPESFGIDGCKHSLFGCSKLAADVLVQEYGRYFGLKTGVFRGGCLTGPQHKGAAQHGFLAYLMRCAMSGQSYTIQGYGGKQVRDNLHAEDLVQAFSAFFHNPKPGAVYNIGGGRESNCSVLEAVALCREITGRDFDPAYNPVPRNGDHIWYISDLRHFQADYPDWSVRRRVPDILREMYLYNKERATVGA